MPNPSGYSGTPLFRKLGIRSGMRVAVSDPPEAYEELLQDSPECPTPWAPDDAALDLLHAFVTRREELRASLASWLDQIQPDGTIWVSWPKRASGVPTDVTEEVVREEALPLGLVDVKVCAVDGTWSGLKLVIRKELRASLTSRNEELREGPAPKKKGRRSSGSPRRAGSD